MMAATLDAFGKEIAARAPLGRIGRPDDMAGVVVFLSSRAGSYVTGLGHRRGRRHRHHPVRAFMAINGPG